MTQRCKTWLWLIMIIYGGLLIAGLINNALHGTLSSIFWANAAVQIALIIGIMMILFWRKRTGFFLMCTINFAAYVINVFFMGNSAFLCMAMFIPLPLITWYFLKTDESWLALR